MTNTQKYLVWGAVLVIIIGLVLSFIRNKNVVVEYNEPTILNDSKDEVYKDLLTAKCYNSEEVEIPCKG